MELHAIQLEQSGLQLEKEPLQLQLRITESVGLELQVRLLFLERGMELHIVQLDGLHVVMILQTPI